MMKVAVNDSNSSYGLGVLSTVLKAKKKISPQRFQDTAYHSLLLQPIPGLDAYKGKLPVKTVIFKKLVFFVVVVFFCLQLRKLEQEKEESVK